MKDYSFTLEVGQTVFHCNEKCPSYDTLNIIKICIAKEQKRKIFNRAFLGSHTINFGEIPLGYLRPLELPYPHTKFHLILRGLCTVN